MRTMHQVLKRGVMIWDRAQLPAGNFERRLARVQAAIAAAGQDAWLVYGDAEQYGDLAYLTHYLPRTRGGLVLVPREGPASLLVSFAARDLPAAKTLTWVDDVRPFGRLPAEVARLVRERGLDGSRIGLRGVEEQLSVGEWEDIQRQLPRVRWEPADDTLAHLRASKEPAELDALRRAATIVRAGLETAAEALRPGVSEREALALVDRQLRYGGAEDTRLLIASGPRASVSLRPPDGRVLAAGDVVLLYVAAEQQRYWAAGGRTHVLGAADATTRGLVERAGASVAAMRAAARPGEAASVVARAGLAALADDALARGALTYGLGHGIGLDLEEPPTIAPTAAAVLETGATLVLQSVLHGPGGAGALVAETVLVESAGAQALAGAESDLVVLDRA